MRKTTLIVHAALGVACLLCSGCKPGHQEFMTFDRAGEHITLGSGYRLAPPDRVRILAPQAPEIDGQMQVRHDGTIHLRLLGDVRIAGLTAREAAAKVESELASYYKEPTVHISVANYASKVIYLYGEIASNGGGAGDRNAFRRPITGRDTIMNLLTDNPPTLNAWLSQIRLIRPDPLDPQKTQMMIIDFEKMVKNGDYTQNVLLQEGDVVWVPPTPLAWVGYRIRELLVPVAPVLAAYTTPAQFMDAQDQYDDDDNDNDGGNPLLGPILLR